MSPSDEIREMPAGLAALAPDDPERIAAYQRAESDPELERALLEGERLMALLDSVEVDPPSEEALQRTSAAILAEMDSDTQRVGVGKTLARIILPLAVAVGPLAVVAKHGVNTSDPKFLAAAALLVLALGAAGALTFIGRMASGLAIATAGVFALAVQQGGFGAIHGAGCLSVTMMSAAAPLIAASGLVFFRYVSGGRAFFAGASATGALAGMAALHLECPGYTLGHLLFFHAGGVALAALLGLAVGMLPFLSRSEAA